VAEPAALAARRGLSGAEVADRVARGLVNDVPSAPTRTIGQIVRSNVLTRFNLLLGSLLAVILVVGPLQDALFGLVIVANTVVGIVQEVRAKRTLDRLEVVNAPRARVVRDGRVGELAVGQVVLDDVLEAAAGDQLVVDGEVLEAAGLEVDESLLTGESEPVARNPGDRLLSGSFVAAGSGRYRDT
jgi:cation-transporting ATPase E